MPWCQTPSRKKKAVVFTTVMTNAYQDQLNAGYSEVCEIFKVCGIESLKYVQEFYTPVCYCGDISTPETWRWTKRTVIGCLTCRSNGLLANESCHGFQTFSSQSEGLATRDYLFPSIILMMKAWCHSNLKETAGFVNINVSNWEFCEFHVRQ